MSFSDGKGRLALGAVVGLEGPPAQVGGQEHAIAVPVDTPAALAGGSAALRGRFDALHDMRYGHAAPLPRAYRCNDGK